MIDATVWRTRHQIFACVAPFLAVRTEALRPDISAQSGQRTRSGQSGPAVHDDEAAPISVLAWPCDAPGSGRNVNRIRAALSRAK